MLLNLFYTFSGILGFISFAIIISQFKYNKLLNIYLLFSFKLLAINFLLIGLHGFNIFTISQQAYYNFYPFLIVIIPAMYLYFVNMVENNNNFNKKQLLHFIAPIVLVSINLIVKHFLISFVPSFSIKLFFSILFIAYVLYYTFISFIFLKKTIWNKKTDLINNSLDKLTKEWGLFIFIVYSLIILHLIIIITINLKTTNNYTLNSYKYIPAILLDIMYFKILFTPEILYGYNLMYKKVKEYKTSNLILTDIWILDGAENIKNIQDKVLSKKIEAYTSNYIQDIEKLVFKHEILRNPNVTAVDIANNLKIPKSHLLFVFKYLSKVSFSEFKKTVCRSEGAFFATEESHVFW
ncbi:MAG: hypothetical protein ABI554_13415 [Flavobacterium sp.]